MSFTVNQQHSILEPPSESHLPVPVDDWQELVDSCKEIDSDFPLFISLSSVLGGGAFSALTCALTLADDVDPQVVFKINAVFVVCLILSITTGIQAWKDSRQRQKSADMIRAHLLRIGKKYGGITYNLDHVSRFEASMVSFMKRFGMFSWLDSTIFDGKSHISLHLLQKSIRSQISGRRSGLVSSLSSCVLISSNEEGLTSIVPEGALVIENRSSVSIQVRVQFVGADEVLIDRSLSPAHRIANKDEIDISSGKSLVLEIDRIPENGPIAWSVSYCDVKS